MRGASMLSVRTYEDSGVSRTLATPRGSPRSTRLSAPPVYHAKFAGRRKRSPPSARSCMRSRSFSFLDSRLIYVPPVGVFAVPGSARRRPAHAAGFGRALYRGLAALPPQPVEPEGAAWVNRADRVPVVLP